MSTTKSKGAVFTGVVAAIAASSCCIPPVIAAIAGAGGASCEREFVLLFETLPPGDRDDLYGVCEPSAGGVGEARAAAHEPAGDGGGVWGWLSVAGAVQPEFAEVGGAFAD